MLICAWHPVINMLSTQEAGLMQQARDTNQQLPLASTVMNVELGQAYKQHGMILQIHQYPEDKDRDVP
jgi:hypothetical protein